jgi:hypothetical protein
MFWSIRLLGCSARTWELSSKAAQPIPTKNGKSTLKGNDSCLINFSGCVVNQKFIARSRFVKIQQCLEKEEEYKDDELRNQNEFYLWQHRIRLPSELHDKCLEAHLLPSDLLSGYD